MRNLIIRAICILVSLSAILSQDANAQKRGKDDIVNTWNHHVKIDGDLSEWGTPMLHSYAGQDLEFELRNDNENIYLAVRIIDVDRQIQAFGRGLSFTINTDGRKREGPAVTFPIADRIAFRGIMSSDEGDRPADTREAALKAVRGIQVQGFDRLLNGMISLENQYGIRAAAEIDTADVLCIEIQLPIHLLNISTNQAAREMAYNLRINGLVIDGMRPRQESGVWNKFKLATSQSED